MNSSKAKVVAYNTRVEHYYIYQEWWSTGPIGSWVDQSEKDLKFGKALTWKACNKMRTLWRSNQSTSLKISFFGAAVESIPLYWAEDWTLTKQLEARLDGCYTRLLMMVLNKN